MQSSAKAERAPPIATDLESLLAVEAGIEQTLADARDRAEQLVVEARARLERDARELVDELERERRHLCAEANARTRADIERIEADAELAVRRYRAVNGARVDRVADRLCELLVAMLEAEVAS